jgi:hypothetical protein
MLNSLIEHDFQDTYEKMREVVGTMHMHERDVLQGCGGQ